MGTYGKLNGLMEKMEKARLAMEAGFTDCGKMLWKTIHGEAAARSGESMNCETCHSFQFPASGNFAANLSFERTENLKCCPKCAKIPSCSGNGTAIPANFAPIV
jgi:hypothetical protein